MIEKPKKPFKLMGLVFLPVVAFALVGLTLHQFKSWSKRPIPLTQAQGIDLLANTSLDKFSQNLYRKKLINSVFLFKLWVKIKKVYPHFQAGYYRFDKATAPQDIISAMTQGKIHRKLVFQLTIPEGYNIKQIATRMGQHSRLDGGEVIELSNNSSFIHELKLDAATLEGYLFPATYKFYDRFPSEKEVLTRAVHGFFYNLPGDYQSSAKKKKLSLTQAVTFASLIEKETNLLSEKSLISEVIWRRLKRGSPIGIDASLIYGIKNYDGDITFKHLRNRKNPYNTRIHKGLPPTPICSPSLSSLAAVLTPTNTGSYFYVLLPGSGGKHHFSKTLKEHRSYVKKLIKASRKP